VTLTLLDLLCLDDNFWEIILDLLGHMVMPAIVMDCNHKKDDAVVMDNLLIIHVLN